MGVCSSKGFLLDTSYVALVCDTGSAPTSAGISSAPYELLAARSCRRLLRKKNVHPMRSRIITTPAVLMATACLSSFGRSFRLLSVFWTTMCALYHCVRDTMTHTRESVHYTARMTTSFSLPARSLGLMVSLSTGFTPSAPASLRKSLSDLSSYKIGMIIFASSLTTS